MTVERYRRMLALNLAEDFCRMASMILRANWKEGSDCHIIAGRLDRQITRALTAERDFQIRYRGMPDLKAERQERDRDRRDQHQGRWVATLPTAQPNTTLLPTAQPNTTLLPTAQPTITLEAVEPEPLPDSLLALETWRERRRRKKEGRR